MKNSITLCSNTSITLSYASIPLKIFFITRSGLELAMLINLFSEQFIFISYNVTKLLINTISAVISHKFVWATDCTDRTKQVAVVDL